MTSIRSTPTLPAAQAEWAYFLDFDGTLMEIAAHPDAVQPDHRLRALLDQLSEVSEGAVAVVSGRSIADIDALLHRPELPVAGQHGAERRGTSRVVRAAPKASAAFDTAKAQLRAVVARHPALFLEDKGLSLAVHYRNAPRLASFVHQTVHALQRALGNDYVTQPGKRVIELKPASCDKGHAVSAFLQEPPFVGRRPVFIGDDATDERGFDVVNRRGGISIKVGRGPTVATYRLPTVNSVRAWLQSTVRAAPSSPSATHRSP